MYTIALYAVAKWEARMTKKQRMMVAWVVYKMNLAGLGGPNAVCEQAEWDEMERAQPGHHTLIKAGITSEPEAERLAREAPGGCWAGRTARDGRSRLLHLISTFTGRAARGLAGPTTPKGSGAILARVPTPAQRN
jgi:hypothetical protein